MLVVAFLPAAEFGGGQAGRQEGRRAHHITSLSLSLSLQSKAKMRASLRASGQYIQSVNAASEERAGGTDRDRQTDSLACPLALLVEY